MCELLVHIAAPSTAKDDRRYAAIAQSILDFKPAAVTRVDGPDFNSTLSTTTLTLDNANDQGVPPTTRFVSFIGGASYDHRSHDF